MVFHNSRKIPFRIYGNHDTSKQRFSCEYPSDDNKGIGNYADAYNILFDL